LLLTHHLPPLRITTFNPTDNQSPRPLLQPPITSVVVVIITDNEQVLFLSMFGCSDYPAGYPLLEGASGKCLPENSEGWGWLGAGFFILIVIMGAYVLPTVLIGIVAISFDTATRRGQLLKVMD
jgi:hypothetical protein